VGELLEFGEHGLAEDRRPHGVDLPVDQVGATLFVFCLAEQVPAEQFFVERARHFGHEDHVVVVLVGL
jgi:hypothetical protein